MKVNISFEHKERHINLLLALYAISDASVHERNQLTLVSDDGLYVFTVRTDVNYVAFASIEREDAPEYWTENISIGDINWLFCRFLWSQYEELRNYAWISKEPWGNH